MTVTITAAVLMLMVIKVNLRLIDTRDPFFTLWAT